MLVDFLAIDDGLRVVREGQRLLYFCGKEHDQTLCFSYLKIGSLCGWLSQY